LHCWFVPHHVYPIYKDCLWHCDAMIYCDTLLQCIAIWTSIWTSLTFQISTTTTSNKLFCAAPSICKFLHCCFTCTHKYNIFHFQEPFKNMKTKLTKPI
jgi:hypothetical protein